MSTRKQLELKLDAKRPRSRLLEGDAPPVMGTVVTLSDRGKEMFLGYSPWVSSETALPPCSGNWDVRLDTEVDAMIFKIHRLSYNADTKTWTTEDWPFPRHLERSYQWRGLARPWEGVFGHEAEPITKPRRRLLDDYPESPV